MNKKMTKQPERYRRIFTVLSVLIPIVVAVLFRVRLEGYDFTFLPPIYATINGFTAVLLVVAVVLVSKGYKKAHEWVMKLCILLSLSFLVMYVLYHMTTDATVYGGIGWIRYVYYALLISHIVLSLVVTPFVLFTFSRALSGNFERHKALAKFTFPIWLFVAVSGVIVFLMIRPYYG